MQPAGTSAVFHQRRAHADARLSPASLVAIAAAMVAGAWAAWRLDFGTEPGAPLLVALTSIAALVGLHLSRRLPGPPLVDRTWATLGALAGSWIVLVATLAVTRLYYSRSFLLASFATLAGFELVARSFRRSRPRVAVVPSRLARALPALANVDVFLLDGPSLDDIDCVAVDLHEPLSDIWLRFVADCGLRGVPVVHAAHFIEQATGRVSLAHFTEQLVAPPRQLYPLVRRIAEVGLIVLTAPVTLFAGLLVGTAIRLESRGPVLFVQTRIGLGGETFRMAKFRSMRVGADASGATFALAEDPRVTRVGRFLRRYRLDELPQLWNVLQGSMSLIGPRPEQPSFVEQFGRELPFYNCRHFVRPGLTGWAQVRQGYAADTDATRVKLEHDLYYVKHQSPTLDCLIGFMTIKTLLTGFGSR